ncbi:MAG TPA: glycosyl hydrolase family 28-related protein, partial [Methylomirabilota bacterium]|nr:glycosyl hydrolase family 28-related protein [Methylomirabilota bacterium]
MPTTPIEQLSFIPTHATNKRSLGAWTSDISVNIINFGADPTGLNDSQPGIQAAITALDGLVSGTGQRGVVFFPPGTYKVNRPVDFSFGASPDPASICFMGCGAISKVQGNFNTDDSHRFIFDRKENPATGQDGQQGGLIVIEKLWISNLAAGGGAIRYGSGTVTGAFRDLTISADLGIICCTQIGISGVTNNTTAAGNDTLHFASTPVGIIPGIGVVDNTNTLAFVPGTTVLSTTSTTVKLSNAVVGGQTVGNGDSISFIPFAPDIGGSSYSVKIEDCKFYATSLSQSGLSTAIFLSENSMAECCDINGYYIGYQIAGNSNTVIGGRIEDCFNGILLGVLMGGQSYPAVGFSILSPSFEANLTAINIASASGGLISSAEINAFGADGPYYGGVQTGISISASPSGATATSCNVSLFGVLTIGGTVTGTFQNNDTITGGTIPTGTQIQSGGPGTGPFQLSAIPNYGIHISNGGDNCNDTLFNGLLIGSWFTQAAIAVADAGTQSSTRSNNVFQSCSATNNVTTAWRMPTTASVAKFIQCNVNEPVYTFTNLDIFSGSGSYPQKQRGDEFWISDSPTAATGNFNSAVTVGGGANQV